MKIKLSGGLELDLTQEQKEELIAQSSGLKVKYLRGIKLTTYVEYPLVAIQNIWKRSLQKLMSIVEIQQSHILLKLIV